MKYNNISYIAAVLAAMASVSCSNVMDEQTSEANTRSMVPMIFTATQEKSGTTRTCIDNSDGDNDVKWQSDDAIAVYDGYTTTPFGIKSGAGTTFAELSGEVASGSSSYNAVYPYSAVGVSEYKIANIVIPEVQTATEGSYDPSAAVMTATATNYDNNFEFKNACAFLKITTTTACQKIAVHVTSGTIAGVFTCSDYSTAELAATDGYEKKRVVLYPASGSETMAAGTYYIAMAPGALTGLTVDCFTSATEYYERTASSATLVKSYYYKLGTVSETNGWTKKTMVTGGYSVSDTKKVSFTTGNLYWTGSDFALESTQIGSARDASGNCSFEIDDHVSYFYWTSYKDYTSGTVAYMPYASTYNSSALSSSDAFWCGIAHPLTIGDISNLYVLTKDEWNYLINSRENADYLYKYRVTVYDEASGKTYSNCLIIAPDAYDFETTPLKAYYTLADLQKMNVTCLPMVGATTDQGGKQFFPYYNNYGSEYGCYWTSSTYEFGSDAYNFCWWDANLSPKSVDSHEARSFGQCIRLVQTYNGSDPDSEHSKLSY